MSDLITATLLKDYIAEHDALPPGTVIGHLIWNTVNDGQYSAADIERIFDELGLNKAMMPGQINPADAFEKATKEIDKFAYPVQTPTDQPGKPTGVATVLVRDVRRDNERIERHLVREIRDSRAAQLGHATVGRLVFHKPVTRDGKVVAKSERQQAILSDATVLSASERPVMEGLVERYEQAYRRYRDFHDGQKLRTVFREYLKYLNALLLKPSGGVYFVHNSRGDEVRNLQKFAEALGTGEFVIFPIPNLPGVRDSIIDAYTTEAEKELQLVLREAAELRAKGKPPIAAVAKLKAKLRETQGRASEHTRTLNVSVDRTQATSDLALASIVALERAALGEG